MKAFKGFDKDMKCRGFQFAPGGEYKEDKAKLCESGFHACKSPLDTFAYYPPASSVYHEVELDEVSDDRHDDDTKVVAKKINVGAKLDIAGICKAQFDYVKDHCTTEHTDPAAATAGHQGAATAGDSGAATAGDSGAATAGEYGAATAGEYGAATAGKYGAATSRGKVTVGENGIATVRGNDVMARGGLGALLVIAVENNSDFNLKEWKTVVVDGETIKADTWYKLNNGELIEASCDD